jgi:hypothetical protein
MIALVLSKHLLLQENIPSDLLLEEEAKKCHFDHDIPKRVSDYAKSIPKIVELMQFDIL